MLTGWWTRLEAAPRLGGPRRHLRELLGDTTVEFFEQVGILRHDGIAQSYPCPAPGGDRCPRDVIEVEGTYCAVCGNRPIECDDVVLTAREAALLTVDLLRLCKAVAEPLRVRGRPEVIRELADVVRVGAVIPEPGMKYPVFLVIRQTSQNYNEVTGALAARNHGSPFGVLVPTDRFVTTPSSACATTFEQRSFRSKARSPSSTIGLSLSLRLGGCWLKSVSSRPVEGLALTARSWRER